MQGRTSLLLSLVVTISIVEIQSAPHTKLFANSYQYPQTFEVRPEYLQIAAYQNAHAPYYVYNLLQVHADLTAAGTPTILPDKQTTTFTHLPPYGYYYGTPIYDFRFPINPVINVPLSSIGEVYPVWSPSHPGYVPGAGSPPISTQRPFDVDNNDDGIEKLDTKVEPETGMRKPGATEVSFDDDDTISVEAI